LEPVKGFCRPIIASIIIQTLFQPWFNAFMAGALDVSAENRQIRVLISTMPAAILGHVFAARYACAARKASGLAFTHILISPVLVPAKFVLFA
jgi:predicted permease